MYTFKENSKGKFIWKYCFLNAEIRNQKCISYELWNFVIQCQLHTVHPNQINFIKIHCVVLVQANVSLGFILRDVCLLLYWGRYNLSSSCVCCYKTVPTSFSSSWGFLDLYPSGPVCHKNSFHITFSTATFQRTIVCGVYVCPKLSWNHLDGDHVVNILFPVTQLSFVNFSHCTACTWT